MRAHAHGGVTGQRRSPSRRDRIEGLDIDPPPGMTIEPERDRSLTELLLAGEIEAMIAPHSPAAFEDRSGQIVRLFSDTQAVEEDYYRRTGIYPIITSSSCAPTYAEDIWPYGVDANRTTLKAFLGYMHEQGLTPRRLEPEELFAPQTLTSFRV